ncbi:MAG TPA: cytochrome c biogenesis CcdA family protein [Dehalococcoidia bacterium]|nr:cytochrome c biogenesis CcdA family protein [Dehalococcoidia bacterium]
MVEVSFIAAFIGGVLSLLSPCSALLLPAFFAYAFQSRRELTARTFIFYLGLSTIFVPLGMGASFASFLFLDNRDTMITVAGALLIAFGVLELAGRSLSFIRMPSGGGDDAQGLFGTYSLGMVYGFGGFCSGPILGSVLTVAATDNNPLHGGSLLAVYALGTVVPLFALALLWDRLDLGRQRWLRGFGVEVGALRIHSTNLIAGALFIVLGLSFILLDGTNALSAEYADLGFEEASFDAEVWVRDATSWIPDEALLALGAVIAAFAGYRFISWMRSSDDDAEIDAPRTPMAPGESD